MVSSIGGHKVSTVALHPEGVDRNTHSLSYFFLDFASPSTRRAWIEILHPDPVG